MFRSCLAVLGLLPPEELRKTQCRCNAPSPEQAGSYGFAYKGPLRRIYKTTYKGSRRVVGFRGFPMVDRSMQFNPGLRKWIGLFGGSGLGLAFVVWRGFNPY